MDIFTNKRLFWFLKEGVRLDLKNQSILDMYIQQIITHGKAEDVRELLKTVEQRELKKVLARVKNFLHSEVRMFWEDFFGNN